MGYDILIAGLGAMGSAAAYHLAKSGHRVLGFDQFRPPHNLGSSHGLTRIIREAYFEHPSYVPLVERAYELWHELEKASSRRLLIKTGGLMIGPPDGALVAGAKRSAETHQLEHRVLSASDVRKQFPAFHPEADMNAVWEPRAGILLPEIGIQTHLELAALLGAVFQFDSAVLRWEPEGSGVRVFTGSGSHRADRLLLSAGAWMGALLPGLDLPLSVERQVLCWFEPRSRPELFQSASCPIYICEYGPRQFVYGFPDLGDGVKAALHHQGELTQPGHIRREVSDAEVEAVRTPLRQLLPDADGRLKSTAVCMYTDTPDEHFVLGRHPGHPQVVIASPCSGHGFKFSPVVGEIAALWLTDKSPPFDLDLFSPVRFGKGG